MHFWPDELCAQFADAGFRAAAVPGSRLVTYPGMGHNLPRELWSSIVAEVAALVR
ncbi:hypothetical protein [Pseudonocardia xinjiangensis]|uniref:hypothetical protein n=1 Tax=Pseudonocardia xinjiangensis TaxID=75289 RepID=UPI001B7D213E|nr:hypothetical protein [Pseudonocardia xinjiangensis]